MARPIIIDCDPGQDDAINLLLAMSSPDELQLLGITTVAGNVPLNLTQRNARLMCDIAGRHDIPVFAGCERPLVRRLITAEEVHGRTGIDGIEINAPKHALEVQHAVDFIIDTLRSAADHSVTLVPTGPLTNIAMALTKAPDIINKVDEIVLMGGASREGGNTTPSAEFNIYVDPHAANIVLHCGRPIVIAGLDVSHQVLVNQDCLERLRAMDSKVATATLGMLQYFNRHDSEKYGTEGGPLHDPCTIAYLLKPELFQGKHVHVAVDIHSELTMGATCVDYWRVTGNAPNTNWIHSIDADGFYELLNDCLRALG